MRMVGVLLVSAMIVIPTLTGFAVARSFRLAIAIAIGAAVASVVVGLMSAYYLRLAAGGSIVLTALVMFGAATLARQSRAAGAAGPAVSGPRRLRPPLGRTARVARAAVAALGLCACAGLRSDPEAPGDLAGVWRGHMQAPAGHAVASLVIAADGTYHGAMYLDGGDKPFRGTIVAAPFGPARYRGSDGAGTVAVEGTGGARVLRFRPDGGGPGGRFSPAP